MKVKDKVQIRVRMTAAPQVEYRYAYWDIYPDTFISVEDFIPTDEKRDLDKLFKENFVEFPDENPEMDVHIVVSTENFIRIQDQLNIELSKECVQLKDQLPIDVKTLEELEGGE
jgi:hypothetical protein